MTTNSVWQAPKAFLKTRGIKLEIGVKFNPVEAGMAPHPMYGPLPEITPITVHEDGTLDHGEILCECGQTRVVGSGDWFQVRRCHVCQAKLQAGNRKAVKSPDEIAAVEAKREAKKAERDAKAEQRKIARDATRQAKEQAREAAKLERAKAKLEKVKAVAAEMGATVSANVEG